MKKLFSYALCALLFLGCKKDDPVPVLPPSTIPGLELAFMETNLNKSFRAIEFLNASVGYIASYDGSIYKTTDGALSWVPQNSTTTVPLHDLYFFDHQRGFAVGGQSSCGGTGCIPPGPVILHTMNGGQTWEHIDLATASRVELRSVFFINSDKGFAVGGSSLFSTTDGGVTWEETLPEGLGAAMLHVGFVNATDGIISCTAGKVLRTLDGGVTWELSQPFPALGAYTVSIVSEDLLYVAGYTTLASSIDVGSTWEVFPGFPHNVYDLQFVSNEVGFAFGPGKYTGGCFGIYRGRIDLSTDGGISWTGNDDIHEMGTITAASFPSPDLGFAVGGGVVVRITRL